MLAHEITASLVLEAAGLCAFKIALGCMLFCFAAARSSVLEIVVLLASMITCICARGHT